MDRITVCKPADIKKSLFTLKSKDNDFVVQYTAALFDAFLSRLFDEIGEFAAKKRIQSMRYDDIIQFGKLNTDWNFVKQRLKNNELFGDIQINIDEKKNNDDNDDNDDNEDTFQTLGDDMFTMITQYLSFIEIKTTICLLDKQHFQRGKQVMIKYAFDDYSSVINKMKPHCIIDIQLNNRAIDLINLAMNSYMRTIFSQINTLTNENKYDNDIELWMDMDKVIASTQNWEDYCDAIDTFNKIQVYKCKFPNN